MTQEPNTWEDDPNFDKEPADYFADLADSYFDDTEACLFYVYNQRFIKTESTT